MSKARVPCWVDTDDKGKKIFLNLAEKEHRDTVLRMLAAAPWPAEFSDKTFQDNVDMDTIRGLVACHRHAETGVWILRIDGLKKFDLDIPVYREMDHRKKDTYGSEINVSGMFRFISGDYGELKELITPYSKKLLPDGSSRLLARVIAHYGTQAFGEGIAATWEQVSAQAYREKHPWA